ncbi:hepcidin isoform X1 [Monodelphis domestica]|uniref:hepcidin isoform X1 n=1 Tax=Monodelphis domestica TaxID=13616 RepID=UPI0004431188|nr:hepcidin isoform X1 [Monodelphis domestica]
MPGLPERRDVSLREVGRPEAWTGRPRREERGLTQDLVETPFQEAAPAAHNGLTPLLQRTKRFNSHFPICSFCCNCCHNTNCGICCRV